MNSALLAIGFTVVIVAVVAVAYVWTQRSPVEPGGFREWVKNPEYRDAAQDFFEQRRRALEVSDDMSDAEIQRMVDQLFVPENDAFNFEKLGRVGERAAPHLVRALDDPRIEVRFEEQHSLVPASPFGRIADLLSDIGPPAAAGPLAPFVQHREEEFRKRAALALGSIGSRECIEPIVAALNDDADYVRSYAMMGISRALDAGRAETAFLDGVFPALTRLLNRSDHSVSGRAPGLLLAIDAERALPVLLSAEYFTPDNRELRHILKALNEADETIPHDRLLPLLAELKPLSGSYPHGGSFGEALFAYARHPDAATESTLRQELQGSSDTVREGAARALARLRGVTDPGGVVFALEKQNGFEALTGPQKHFSAVAIYDGQVNNGGHSQFFVNPSGYYWRSALSGLRAIGATERARILEEATQLFGSGGPAEDDDLRHQQLAAFSAENDQAFNALDTRYYACKEKTELLLSLYASEHPADFVAPGR